MLKYLLFSVLLISTIVAANKEDISNSNQKEHDLYLSYETLPKKIYINQVFTLTSKIINANKDYTQLVSQYGTFDGVKVLSLQPQREQKNFTSYDTFYFKAIQSQLKTPSLLYSLNRADETQDYEPVSLQGHKSFALTLNSDEDFCNVLANELKIESFKTTNYDQANNIMVFTVSTLFGNLEDFNLTIASIQGFESISQDLPMGRMTYYAVFPKHLRNISFNYFNLYTEHYMTLSIPVEVDDDSVSTQMDLSPTQYTHSFAKIVLASTLIILGLILYLATRQKRYFFIIALTPILYVAWVYFPKEQLCIKADAKIYLLPMNNSTIFQKYTSLQKLQKLGTVDNYNKVLLPNLNIGWIKDEDLCQD